MTGLRTAVVGGRACRETRRGRTVSRGRLTHSRARCSGWLDPAGEATLAHWALCMEAEGTSSNTVDLRLGAVRLAVRHAGVGATELRPEHLRAWLADHHNANTRATYHAAVARFHSWLLAESLRADNPLDRVRKSRVPRGAPRPCTTAALAAMLAAASPRDRDMLVLGAYQGLRAEEIAGIRGEDIDAAAQTIRVCGKGGVTAVVPLHPVVAAMAVRMPTRGCWFPSTRRPGQPMRAEVVTAAARRACLAAGIPGHGAHPLRHWYATWLVRGGADLRTVQTLMRHSSLATTARYVEVADDARRAAVLRLPELEANG